MPGAPQPLGVDDRMPLGLDQLGRRGPSRARSSRTNSAARRVSASWSGWALTLGIRIRALSCSSKSTDAPRGMRPLDPCAMSQPPFRDRVLLAVCGIRPEARTRTLHQRARLGSRLRPCPAGGRLSISRLVREGDGRTRSRRRHGMPWRHAPCRSSGRCVSRINTSGFFDRRACTAGVKVYKMEPLAIVGLTSRGQSPYFPKLDSSFCGTGRTSIRPAENRESGTGVACSARWLEKTTGSDTESGRMSTLSPSTTICILEFASARPAT